MSGITTHVLDTSLGRPAAGITAFLERVVADQCSLVGQGVTNQDGRIADWGREISLEAGTYQVRFDTAGYFALTNREAFFPQVSIQFCIADDSQHYHVPLLLSNFGYSTYRGS